MVADGAPLIVSGSVEHLLTGLQEFSSYKITAKVFYETEVTILTSETVTTLPAGESSSCNMEDTKKVVNSCNRKRRGPGNEAVK